MEKRRCVYVLRRRVGLVRTGRRGVSEEGVSDCKSPEGLPQAGANRQYLGGA